MDSSHAWPNRQIRIYHTNAQSLRHKVDELEVEIQDIEIVCLSETWLGESVCQDDLTILNFNGPHRKDRGYQEYGGVAIYTKNGLPTVRRSDVESDDLEIIWLEITTTQGKLLVGCCYRAPNSSSDTWPSIEANIDLACETGLHVILTGDINVDMTKQPNIFSNILSNCGLYLLNCEPTHRLDNSATCIDVIATNRPSRTSKAALTCPILSRQNGLVVGVGSTGRPRSTSYTKSRINYGRADWTKICDDLASTDWSDLLNSDDLEFVTEKWTHRFQCVIKKHTPTTRAVVHPNDKPWMTPKLRRMIKNKDREYKKCLATGKHHSDSVWSKYRDLKQGVKTGIAAAKETHFAELADKLKNSGGDKKQWWKAASLVFGKQKDLADMSLLHEDSLISDNHQKANIFNAFFAKITTVSGEDDQHPALPIHTDPLMDNIVFTIEETEKALHDVNKESATGSDDISNISLYNTRHVIAPVLTVMFNKCMSQGKMPNFWKSSIVIPIYKQGPRENVTNYRPISLLSCPSKILERLVHNRVLSHLLENDLIAPEQCGFLKGSSCTSQLLEIVNRLSEALDRNYTSKAVFLDLSKAFDKV